MAAKTAVSILAEQDILMRQRVLKLSGTRFRLKNGAAPTMLIVRLMRLNRFTLVLLLVISTGEALHGNGDSVERDLRERMDRIKGQNQQRANDAKVRRAHAAAAAANRKAEDAIIAAEGSARETKAEVRALQNELAELNSKLRNAEHEREKAESDERARIYADNLRQERERLESDPEEQKRRAVIAAVDASTDRAYEKYPILAVPDSPHRRALLAFVAKLQEDPARAEFFQTADWPEKIVEEFAATHPIPPKVGYSMRKLSNGEVLLIATTGERYRFKNEADAQSFITDARSPAVKP